MTVINFGKTAESNTFREMFAGGTKQVELSNGNVVHVWYDDGYRTSGSADDAIYARVFDADGNALTGDIQVNEWTGGGSHPVPSFSNVTVSESADGGFNVFWQSYGQSAVQDTDPNRGGAATTDLMTRSFDSAGTATSSETVLEDYTYHGFFNDPEYGGGGTQTNAMLLSNGHTLVTWIESDEVTNQPELNSMVLDENMNIVHDETGVLSTSLHYYAGNPDSDPNDGVDDSTEAHLFDSMDEVQTIEMANGHVMFLARGYKRWQDDGDGESGDWEVYSWVIDPATNTRVGDVQQVSPVLNNTNFSDVGFAFDPTTETYAVFLFNQTTNRVSRVDLDEANNIVAGPVDMGTLDLPGVRTHTDGFGNSFTESLDVNSINFVIDGNGSAIAMYMSSNARTSPQPLGHPGTVWSKVFPSSGPAQAASKEFETFGMAHGYQGHVSQLDNGNFVYHTYGGTGTSANIHRWSGTFDVDGAGPKARAPFEGDGVVEGTAGDDLIDATYLGDPQGDLVDGGDATLGNGRAGTDDDVIRAGDGNDTVLAGAARDTIDGGAGNDSLDGGTGADSLIGGDGSDTLIGGEGDDDFLLGPGDVAQGGSGDDEFRLDPTLAGSGTVTIAGGETGEDGTDTVNGSSGDVLDLSGLTNVSVLFDETDPTWDGNTSESGTVTYVNDNGDTITVNFSEIETVTTGAADGIVSGTGNDNLIDDSYTDLDGDRVDASDATAGIGTPGSDEDSIDAGAGNDTVLAGAADDTVAGGAGNDSIDGGAGNDELHGDGGPQLGPELLTNGGFEAGNPDGGWGFNTTENPGWTGDGYTTYSEEGGPEYRAELTSSEGTDYVTLGSGGTTTHGTIRQTLATPMAAGEDHVLTFDAMALNSTGSWFSASATPPPATVQVLDQNGTVLGQVTVTQPSDTNTYANYEIALTPGVEVTELRVRVLGEGQWNSVAIDNLSLRGFQDSSQIGDGADSILGRDGADTIFGQGGDDTLDGGADADLISGGEGADVILGGTGDDTLMGDAGSDALTGGAGADSLLGGDGDDDFLLGGGDAGLGESGDDVFTFDKWDTETGAVTVVGGETGEDLTDPSNGGAGDTLDLRGLDNVVVTYDQTDPTWDGTTSESGTVTYTNNDGATITVNFAQIENILTSPPRDGIVEGTVGNDRIDGSYTGDPEGDLVDNSDATNGIGVPGSNDDSILAGDGNDTVLAGDGNDTVEGGAGDDQIQGGTGTDSLLGGEGNDTFTLADGSGADTIVGGEDGGGTDQDVIDHTAGTTDVLVTFTGDETGTINDGGVVTQFSEIEAINLGAGNDTVNNFNRPASINVDGGSGDDSMLGGTVDDTLIGGTGNDTLNGAQGNDSLDAGDGNDTVYSGDGDDTVSLGDGNDWVSGDGGDDLIDGGSGRDTIFGNAGQDSITAGDGDDVVDSGTDNDTVDGGAGDDSIISGAGDDSVLGGDGSDTLSGGEGADSLDGGAGDDDIAVGGADSALGGSGDDVFALDSTDPAADVAVTLNGGTDATDGNPGGGENGDAGDVLDLSDQTDALDVTFGTNPEAGTVDGLDTVAGDADITFAEIERVRTGTGDDTIDGSTAAGPLDVDAGGGNDTVLGGDGDDTVWSGAGDDSISGGAGDDSIDAHEGADTLIGGTGADTLRGWQGDDLISVGGRDTAFGGHGDDRFVIDDTDVAFDMNVTLSGDNDATSGHPDDAANGDAGDILDLSDRTGALDVTFGADGESGTVDGLDIFANDVDIAFSEIEQLHMGSGDDTVDGSAATGPLTVSTGDGDDSVAGGSGNDTLTLGAGADTVAGGAGDDLIDVGAGDGVVDLVILGSGSGDDTVSGFAPPTDNGDGTFTPNDQLDVSGLTDAGGDPVDTRDVVVTDDGSGNAVLTFPNGESVTLIGVDPTVAQNLDYLTAMGIPVAPDGTVDGTGGDDVIDDSYTGDPHGDLVDHADALAELGIGRPGTDDDRIEAGAGNDTVLGGAGHDTIGTGLGAGDDWLDGGDGNDSISGDDGHDTIIGGTGADTLAGGAGNDEFRYSAGDGADTISDFGHGNTGAVNDGDATNNDRIDLSAFYDTIWEIHADQADDGILNQSNTLDSQGNAVDYSDNASMAGGGLTILGATADANTYTWETTSVACFAATVQIATVNGPVPAHRLRAGDRVLTRDNGPQPIRWICSTQLGAADLRARPHLAPIRISPGALGAGSPDRPLLVSPQHRMLLQDDRLLMLTGDAEALAPARHLLHRRGVRQVMPSRGVRYIHILLDRHELLKAHGCWSESFHPGDGMLGTLDQAQRNEFADLFPTLTGPELTARYPVARPILRHFETAMVRT